VVEKPLTPAPAPAETRGVLEGLPPSVRRLVGEHRLDLSLIRGSGPAGRLTKGDVLLYIEQSEAKPAAAPPAAAPVCAPCESVKEEISRKPMTPSGAASPSACSRPARTRPC